jgi:isocitrate lyase
MKHADVLALENHWETDPRWAGVERSYSAEDVVRLRGSLQEEQTLARRGAERLWTMLEEQSFVRALGAMTGGQAVQMVKDGLQAIYLSGWQVAADANLSGQTYPDQSLYPANSVPAPTVAGARFLHCSARPTRAWRCRALPPSLPPPPPPGFVIFAVETRAGTPSNPQRASDSSDSS